MENVVRSFKDSALEENCFNMVIVRDSIESIGGPQVWQHLLWELHNVADKGRAQARGIVLLALERAPEEYSHHLHQPQNSIQEQPPNPLQVLDCFSDPLGWDTFLTSDSSLAAKGEGETQEVGQHRSADTLTEGKPESRPGLEPGPSGGKDSLDDHRAGDGAFFKIRFGGDGGLEGLKEGIQSAGEAILKDTNPGGRLALAVDSMSTLLHYCPASKVLAFLEWLRWSGRISTILALLHADLHSAPINASFERLASTVIDVQAPPLLDQRGSADGRIHVRHKTKKGKVRHEREQFWLEPSGVRFGPIERTASVAQLVAETSTSMQSGRAPPPAKAAPNPEVPFSLELSEAEKRSRARVVLPYEHRGDGHEVKVYDGRPGQGKSKRDGHISYESSDDGLAPANSLEALGKGADIGAGEGRIMYERDSDEEPPDSDEDPDDDLDI